MRPMFRTGLLLLPFALFACAHSAEKRACRDADYYQMGLQDGQNGQGRDRLIDSHKRCDKVDVPVADAQYQEGYRTGITEFCTPERAQADAAAIKPNQVCMSENMRPYADAYKAQLEQVRAEREHEISKVQDQANALQKRKQNLKKDVNKIDEQKEKASEQPGGF